jgi:hypothetical protein
LNYSEEAQLLYSRSLWALIILFNIKNELYTDSFNLILKNPYVAVPTVSRNCDTSLFVSLTSFYAIALAAQ